eukprot:TRINITY_DN37909_c0_g1_i1.p1 TRINITY_DN37909_c0_g1~~TRINITY_DN37909_c0_g1_i1.p1  ORF type:complete len:2477 (+),score=440.02 TRINITY_DN37909_c0_g1_i1:179-7432(+)
MVSVGKKTTEVKFESPPYLKDGDLITLGDNVECDDNFPYCNEEKISVVKGLYRYADGGMPPRNHELAQDYYIAGHALTTTDDDTVVTIPVGWETETPTAKVASRSGKRGAWTRHSQAITRQEVLGTRQMKEMRVCWRFGGPLGTYVAEAGTLTLMDSNPMSTPIGIHLTSTVVGVAAPMILTFRTAASATGERYTTVQGPTQIKIFFTRTISLDASFADGSRLSKNAGEDEILEARQFICGKLFREAWSSDTRVGFPMPRGCYYKIYGITKELNMVFDAKNGLAPGEDYQLVIVGTASEEAELGGEYVNVFTMDDINLYPYTSIERGRVRLDKNPQFPAYGSDGVKFLRPDGFKIVGGDGAQMVELRGGVILNLALKGDRTGGGISSSAILRVFLWPLLMWDVERACTAVCIPQDQVMSPCGVIQDCKGVTTVPNFMTNVIRVVMPFSMTTMDESVSHTVAVEGIRFPEGGFFSTRISAQIAKPDDTKPDYIESVGDFIYKRPSEGQAIGKLVQVHGDGNMRPFRGDEKNILYAVISLAATLFSAIQTGDAVMTIFLPDGYTCVRMQDVPGPCLVPKLDGSPCQTSSWRAEDDLQIFDGVPRGSGSPDEGSGTRGWSAQGNMCKFTLRQNGVVYGRSVLLVRITVNNPPFPLKRENSENRWSVGLTAKGYHQYPIDFRPEGFKTIKGNFSDNAAVLGLITEAMIWPTKFMRSIDMNEKMRSTVHIIFTTEQDTGVEASVQVVSPPGFMFENPCMVAHLPTNYYGASHIRRTFRLPGSQSCHFSLLPFTHIKIKLTGALLAATTYGFMTEVTNAYGFEENHLSGWKIFTMTKNDYRVDGTPFRIEFVKVRGSLAQETRLAERSYNLCEVQLNEEFVRRFEVEFESLLPYSVREQYSMDPPEVRIHINTLKVPASAEGLPLTLTIVAPDGFLWNTTDENFLWRTFQPNISNVFEKAEADLPGGIPRRDGNVLMWSTPVLYDPDILYAFSTYIRVPERSPTTSANAFFAVFGYGDGRNVTQDCFAAAFYEIPPVSALSNPAVDYYTNVESRGNTLMFTIETVSHVPADGALVVEGPGLFVFQPSCSVAEASPERGSPYVVEATGPLVMSLPDGISCSSSYHGELSKVSIRLGGVALPRGRYRWQMLVTNPNQPMANEVDELKICGYEHCWTFHTVDNADMPIDSVVAVKSFPINRKMVQAVIAPLTEEQQRDTGRNDRPTHYNPLTFLMQLEKGVMLPTMLRLRAPNGFIFREDCTMDVELRASQVFGGPLPDDYTEWNPEVYLRRCRGEGPDAWLEMDPGNSLGLRAELKYPFRVAVLQNPSRRPNPNKWTMEYGGESSDPFDSFDLWTFVRLSIHKVSAARSTPVTNAVLVRNPVTITLRPYNTVRGRGMAIKVTAPMGYQIANDNGACKLIVQPVTADYVSLINADPDGAPEPNFNAPPSLRWGDADVDCNVDFRNTPRLMVVDVLAEIRELTANRDYQLTVFVHNPTFDVLPEFNIWKIETSDSRGNSPILPLFRDEVSIQGYKTNPRAREWYWRNEDPETGGMYERGLVDVLGLYFQFMFPNKLENGNEIIMLAPTNFRFENVGGSKNCLGFRWAPKEERYLPQSEPFITCEGGMMKIVINEEATIPQMTRVKFRIDTKNPPKTSHIMENYWRIYHYANGEIMASEAAVSWQIKPQLKQMRIMLSGILKAAGFPSAMTISFVPVSDADEIFLEAHEPKGFDFTGCYATSLSHEVISTDIERVRVRASMYSDVQIDVRIEGFRLGYVGGPTRWDIITRLSNGMKMDESLNFEGGFRMPGHLKVSEEFLPTLTSFYKLAPNDYPVASLWGVRMGERALARFRFSITLRANIADMLRLQAPVYALGMEYFQLSKSSSNGIAGHIVTAEVVNRAGGTLVAQLGEVLWPVSSMDGIGYEVQVDVTTPQLPNPADGMWTIDILDGGPLPLNTNDGTTEGFALVDQIAFTVRPMGAAPPMAEVGIDLFIDPKTWAPTEAILVAPLGYNFTTDCLVSPGDFDEVSSCERMPDTIAGRAAALLIFNTGGLLEPTAYVVLKVKSPPDNGVDRSWFLQIRDRDRQRELGWGEDPTGVEIRQMMGASVVYPGIPDVEGRMVLSFITNEKVNEGGKILVGYPPSITVRCVGDFLDKVSLQGDVTCDNKPRLGEFEVTISRPLPPGTQAFAVTSTAPPAVEGSNTFFIMIKQADGQVVDAAMTVPGVRIQHGLAVAALPLWWSSSVRSKPSTVSLGFELLDALPEVNPPLMGEVVVFVPRDFVQNVKRTLHIESLGRTLPLAQGSWLDNSNKDRLRLFFDPALTRNLTPGRYRWSFPVAVPSRLPAYNVFVMTICTPASTNQSCTGPDDPRALVTFPWPSFNQDEPPPVDGDMGAAMPTGGASRGVGNGHAGLLLLCLAPLVAAVVRVA